MWKREKSMNWALGKGGPTKGSGGKWAGWGAPNISALGTVGEFILSSRAEVLAIRMRLGRWKGGSLLSPRWTLPGLALRTQGHSSLIFSDCSASVAVGAKFHSQLAPPFPKGG